jgi:DNA-binding beta-propeller fold protein YncE
VLLALAVMTCPMGTLVAGTFERTPLAPEVGLDVLTRRVAREQVGRELFSNPYATVTIANVDVYDRFPYVESRHVQVVSDPRWNRLVFGERGQGLRAWDGAGSAVGALAGPRGMAVDERDRLYVADTGNDRLVVLQAATDRGEVTLTPLFEVTGLAAPHDVAYSDAGTPFATGDDVLYVAETGLNRVAVLALEGSGARMVTRLGDLGGGVGRFAGPMAIAVGRSDGINTRDVYVADAHNRRIVHLVHEGNRLRWAGETRHEASLVTSLATDQWGNLYAASPQAASVSKFSPDLVRVAELTGDLTRPRSFHVPFVTVRDHRDGRVTRAGQPNGVSVDQWSEGSGVGLWKLGVELSQLAVQGGDRPVAHFTLTDRATVSLRVTDASSGRTLATRSLGAMPAGLHTVPLEPADLTGAASGRDLVLRVSAVSRYADGPSDVAQARFQVDGGGQIALPDRPVLLGSSPNPMTISTRIALVLPDPAGRRVSLGLYDASGRRLRTWSDGFTPGLNEVEWDGTDDQGRAVRAGVYFYRLELGAARETGRIALVR